MFGIPKYIDITTDFGFKRVFGEEHSKPVLKHFLFSMLDLPSPIVELTWIQQEQLSRSPHDRTGIFDISCKDENGRQFIVEMQKRNQPNFADRMLYYSTFPLREQAEKGEWDYQMETVYCIGIMDFKLFNDRRYFRQAQILDLETHEVTCDKLAFAYVELPKFHLTLEQLSSDREKWVYFIKHAIEFQEVPAEFSCEPFDEAFATARHAKMTDDEAIRYERSLKDARDRYSELKFALNEAKSKGLAEGLAEGEAKGLAEGLAKGEAEGLAKGEAKGELKGKIEVAQAMIAQGIPLSQIVAITGLTAEQIDRSSK